MRDPPPPGEGREVFVIARSGSDEAIQMGASDWIASRSLSLGRPLLAGPVGSHLRMTGDRKAGAPTRAAATDRARRRTAPRLALALNRRERRSSRRAWH